MCINSNDVRNSMLPPLVHPSGHTPRGASLDGDVELRPHWSPLLHPYIPPPIHPSIPTYLPTCLPPPSFPPPSHTNSPSQPIGQPSLTFPFTLTVWLFCLLFGSVDKVRVGGGGELCVGGREHGPVGSLGKRCRRAKGSTLLELISAASWVLGCGWHRQQ